MLSTGVIFSTCLGSEYTIRALFSAPQPFRFKSNREESLPLSGPRKHHVVSQGSVWVLITQPLLCATECSISFVQTRVSHLPVLTLTLEVEFQEASGQRLSRKEVTEPFYIATRLRLCGKHTHTYIYVHYKSQNYKALMKSYMIIFISSTLTILVT